MGVRAELQQQVLSFEGCYGFFASFREAEFMQ
jgi:hypothetical protein